MSKRKLDSTTSWLSDVEAELLLETLKISRTKSCLSGVQRHQIDEAINCLTEKRKLAKQGRVILNADTVRQVLLTVTSCQQWLQQMFDEYGDGVK